MAIVTVRETVTYDVDRTKLAKGVAKLVEAKLKQDLANWKTDISMKQMFLQDAADGMKVCELLAEGRWKEAETHIQGMDTAARDYVWEFVDEVAGVDFFELMNSYNG